MAVTGKIEPLSDPTGKVQKLADTVDRLYRRGAIRTLRRLLAKLHPADLAAVLEVMPDGHLAPVFEAIPEPKLASEVLSQLIARTRDHVLEEIPYESMKPVFEQLPPDDLTDLIQHLPPEYAEKVVAQLAVDSKQEVEELLSYAPDTAGGIMTPDFFALEESVTVHDAIAKVREHYDVELVSYLYVTDGEGHLTGVVSLRQLLLAQPDVTLGEIRNSRIVSVRTDSAQEQVAELVDKYQLLALPVVDDDDVLVGMVTIDDVIDVIEAQNTQQMLQMAGTRVSETLTESPFRIALIRLPWLAVAFAGGLVATVVMDSFESSLTQVLALAAFIPVVMGMAGNVGVQTATVAVRSLAIGTLAAQDSITVLFKELRVGILLGIAYGGALAVCGWYLYGNLYLAQAVGLTLLVNMTGAAMLGIMLPLIFDRIGADPAIATGPFVTTSIDVLGILSYFLIANAVIGIVQ